MNTFNLNSNNVTIPAGFWLRAVAGIIDAFILIALYFVVCFSTGLLGAMAFGQEFVTTNGASLVTMWQIVLPWLYFSIMESSEMQATFGKKVLGLQVTDMSLCRISFGCATGRFFGKLLSLLLGGIGFIMIAFTPRRQGLHDVITNTNIIRTIRVPVMTRDAFEASMRESAMQQSFTNEPVASVPVAQSFFS